MQIPFVSTDAFLGTLRKQASCIFQCCGGVDIWIKYSLIIINFLKKPF